MIGTCPDIAFAVTHLLQFSTNPTKDHYKAAQYICCYLVGTCDYKLIYTWEEDKVLVAFTDSDWAADKIWWHSITGYFFKLANGIILWRSHAHKTVALSSMEAEYMAISDCSRQVIWIKNLIKELVIEIRSILIYGDNQGSTFIASNAVQESCTKHINIHYHYICTSHQQQHTPLATTPLTSTSTSTMWMAQQTCLECAIWAYGNFVIPLFYFRYWFLPAQHHHRHPPLTSYIHCIDLHNRNGPNDMFKHVVWAPVYYFKKCYFSIFLTFFFSFSWPLSHNAPNTISNTLHPHFLGPNDAFEHVVCPQYCIFLKFSFFVCFWCFFL